VRRVMLFVVGSTLSLSALYQANSQTAMTVDTSGPVPAYRVVVTSRTIQAVNYRHRSGASEIGFAGTALLPSAVGTAKVRSKRGTLEVEAEFDNLQNPTTFGSEYLTYVLWAISPEGRPVNLGEVLVGSNDRSKLTATTDLQAFALIVTAEPYYAVRQPSDVVVLENVVRADTKGSTEEVDAKYELLERGGYLPTGYKFDPIVLNANLPLEFYEARNALRIAQLEGADRYASESYRHAVQQMTIADNDAISSHVEKKPLIAAAREAVQTAEDAREIAVKRIEGDRLLAERQASADAQARAQAQADNAMQLRNEAQSDAARAQADAARAQADTARNQAASAAAIAASQAAADQAQADAARAQADTARNQAASAAAIAASQADADQAQANAARAQADAATNQAASAAAIAAAQADADKARLIAQQADSDKAAMRTQLSLQLNRILQTRDSARGLIVSMSDVLFDTGRYSLKPGAREKLAKVAGILMAYPSLNIEVGGYTDNVGGDDMNQRLSENRAGAVRDYLVQQGVGTDSVSAKGFGNSLPVASNDNSAGRQENRRVELLVSGDAIGTPMTVTTGSLN
jgi:outer membrane protein OmpA-like peptidoglycan-associated protein